MRLASGLLAIGLGLGATAGWAGPAKTPAFPVQFGGPFELVDHHGQPRSDHEFRGRFLLLFFGYTHCPDICPTGLQTITEALEMLGARAGKLQPLFVSVDPRRDGPAVLRV
ncbi:MAG: SCO family protein [Alphaproteobacteria bacterium]|nr:SCO family protein [Alphaproteobacteria bacterium]